MVNQRSVPAPPIQEPIAGPGGRLSPLWASWFNKFYTRAGAGEVTPVDDLEVQQAYDFDTIPAGIARETVDNQIIDQMGDPIPYARIRMAMETFEALLANQSGNVSRNSEDLDIYAAMCKENRPNLTHDLDVLLSAETPPVRRYAPEEKYIPGMVNAVINGGCMSSSRPSATITTSFAYGPVDLLAVKADGTVSAGTVSQATAATSLTQTAHACFVENCTLTGAGAIYFRHRIEAKTARRFVDQIANFSCRVYHDVGSAKNAKITINKADSADDFSSVTEVATATISVPDATNHTVEMMVSDMGDCANGIEIEIKIDTGAITTKDVYCGDIQLSIGAERREFEIVPFPIVQTLVRRYLYPVVGFVGVANSASNMQAPLSHPGMRAAPSYAATGALDMTDGFAADKSQSSADVNTTHENTADNGRVSIGNFSGLTSQRFYIHRGTSDKILASAEL